MKMTLRIFKRCDTVYYAVCPSLPGCEVQAPTREAAREKIEEAVVGYLASMDVALPAEQIEFSADSRGGAV